MSNIHMNIHTYDFWNGWVIGYIMDIKKYLFIFILKFKTKCGSIMQLRLGYLVTFSNIQYSINF